MNIGVKKNRGQRGAAFAEFVLIIPLLVMLIGAVFEISRLYYIQNTLEYAAKEAARVGSSIREGVDADFMSRGTIPRDQLEGLIRNSIRVMGVIEEPEQFTIKYLNPGGNEIMGVQDLPFDRQNNPGAIDYVLVEVTYPGVGPGVNTPIPAFFNPANVFQDSFVLMAKAAFQIEGRLER